ncbi:MAG: hypothetical protein GAK28_04164 [Luteibacter sp.]|uniref:GYF domain-containing protein n=1 Tax=Luteibacter sp. TaxID=1886636 RepID=UPI0013834354|nr:GYF domain-containing protein [Luteibacter sp.]KAF1004145.1 MAG: hypothetical protein GAK28_04164 [Luteibacter sp.]
MDQEREIWLGRGQEKFGPYAESVIRQWLIEGKVKLSMLAWVDGMESWRPLHEVLGLAPESTPPPMPPGAFGSLAPSDASVLALPEPPNLHWFLVLLLCIPTLGLMGVIWPFVQASWIKKIDPSSKATNWLIASMLLTVGVWVFAIVGQFADAGDGLPPISLIGFQGLVGLAQWACLIVAFFSMADSMRRVLTPLGLVPEIGGVTLFFFTTFYLQGQMSWVARWRATGRVDPPAPKAVFWVLWCVPVGVVLVVLLALMAALGHG